MSLGQDKSDSIFFSDEQEQNFKIDEIKISHQENIIGNFFNESRASGQEACILQDDIENQCEANMNTQLEASNMSLVKSFNIIIKDHLQDKVEGCSDFIPEETGKLARLRKTPRASDQNLCKRYHTLANKCLREMSLYKHIAPHIKKIHKRSFFIFVLIICKKVNRFGQFVEAYQDKIINMICQISQENKSYKIGSKYEKKNRMLIESFYDSMDAIAYFENGDIQGALKYLFDWKKMKRLSRIDEALRQVEDFGLKTQIL